MLWVALGLVLLAMQKLRTPESARRLSQVFSQQPNQTTQPVATDSTTAVELADIDFSAVEDNTYFRTKESPAWFALFAQLQTLSNKQLSSTAAPELTYAQLLGQPEVYRGQWITVRGTVLREEIQQPAENDLGINTYHRLWIQPVGGGEWPMVVYVLNLPAEFPRGNDLQTAVSVSGFFFKNWSYSWQEGLGLAPVVLAKDVQWSPPVVRPPAELPTGRQTAAAICGAIAFAGLVVWLALKNTRRAGLVIVLIAGGVLADSLALAQETAGIDFREVLKLSGVETTGLARISLEGEPTEADWKTLLPVLHRLRQFQHQPESSSDSWQTNPQEHLGKLVSVSGTAIACERIALPERLAKLHELPALYRCQFRLLIGNLRGVVYTRQRPSRWASSGPLDQPIRFRGVILSTEQQGAVLLLADHLEWFPTRDAPAGQVFLARHGMDAALFDEVRHKRRFVLPQVSREGEAFYACLAALRQADEAELMQFARQSVRESAKKWSGVFTETENQLSTLRRQTADAEQTQHNSSALRQRATLADLVLQRAKAGRSSVAPLLVQPEKETGQLVLVEGIARRSVRIVVGSESAAKSPVASVPSVPSVGGPALDSYYEIEVFTPHSRKLRNLPVVCCIAELPEGFPQGDKIREPVRLAGVFFKSWVYATRTPRKSLETATPPLRVFAPIVLGKKPVWLPRGTATRENRWAVWAGVAFLLGLAIMWVASARLARRDRHARRATLRSPQPPTNPWDDMQKDGST